MILKSKEELEQIRWKINNNQTDFNKLQKDCLKSVYEEIQKEMVGKTRILDTSCHACITSAIGVVKNYIMYHEPKQSELKNAKVRMIVEEHTPDMNEQLEGMTLSELRAKYPHIKSNSVKGFIEKLKNQ